MYNKKKKTVFNTDNMHNVMDNNQNILFIINFQLSVVSNADLKYLLSPFLSISLTISPVVQLYIFGFNAITNPYWLGGSTI